MEYLWEEVQVWDEGGLKDDRDVAGVEEFDWIRNFVASNSSVTESQFNSETLEVDDDEEYNDRS